MPGLFDFPEFQQQGGGLLGLGQQFSPEEMTMRQMMQQYMRDPQLPPRGYPSPQDLGPAQGNEPTLQQQRQGMQDYDALQAQRAGMAALAAGQPMSATPQPQGQPLTHFRGNVMTPYGYAEEMARHNGMLSASQTQYANDRPIQVFRPGIPNPIWGWGR